MNGCIKYFDNGNKIMSFVTEDEKVCNKYNEIWELIRKLLKVKYSSDPIRDCKYIVNKLKLFNKLNKTIFNNSLERIPLEKHTYNCIAAINIDSAKLETNDIKKIYTQAYLEQCKYKLKEEKVVNFIDSEIIDDSDDDINDAVDTHLNFLVPDSYVEI